MMLFAHRKLNLALMAFGATLLGMFLFGHARAAADTWCDVLAPHADHSAYSCHGVTENALFSVSNKSTFESALDDYLSYGGYQTVGAKYIVNGLGGSDWKTRLSNPNVGVKIDYYYTCTNTAYDPGSNSVVQYGGDCPSNPNGWESVVFYNTKSPSTIYYVIKRDCGNPLGNLPGLPKYNPDTPPSGSVNATCNADHTGNVRTSFSDPDGNTTAKLTINFAGSDPNGVYNYGTSGTRDQAVSKAHAAGAWSVTLVVQDYGGSSDKTYTDSANCNVAPSGSVSATCNANGTGNVATNFSDGNGNTTAVLTITFAGGSTGSYSFGTSGARNTAVTAAHANGSWSAKLVVQDYGGSSDKTYTDSSASCNKPPVGSISAASCTSFAGTAYDPNSSSTTLPLKFSVYEGTSTSGTRLANEIALSSGAAPAGLSQSGTSYSFSPLTNATMKKYFGGWESIYILVYARDTTSGAYSSVGGHAVSPCPKTSCSANTFSGDVKVGPSDTFTVTVTATEVNSPTGAATTYGFSPPSSDNLSVTVKNGTTTVYNNADVGYNYAYPKLTSGNITYSTTTPGTYTMSYSFPYLSSTTGCGGDELVGYQPYFSVGSGSIAAGVSLASSCSTATDADLASWNLGSTSYTGAGADVGAIATGNITGFVSGNRNSILGHSMSLANTSDTLGTNQYGGSSGNLVACIPAATAPSGATTLPGGGSLTSANLPASGTYSYTGTLTVNSLSVPTSRTVDIYVTGNVYLAGNVTYGSYSVTDPSTIPRLSIHATGSIYVNSAVTQVHGLYAAPTGTFYSCASAAGTAVSLTSATGYATCNHQLTVYGSVVAKQLSLHRTWGSTGAASGVSVQPAEQFVYSPELWLSQTGQDTGYDAITGLPPVL